MNPKSIISELRARIGAYLSSIAWKNLFLFLFFLLVAFIFWLMLFFQRDVEGVYKIPLKYNNIPHDVVFDEPLPEFIEVRVADKGLEMFKLEFFKKDSIELDIEEFKNNRVNALQGNQYMQVIRTRLAPSTQLRGYSPASISLRTSKLESKELLITFDGEIATNRASLIVDTVTFIPKTVTAYGSKDQLKELTSAKTEYKVFNNLRSTSQYNIKINSDSGIKFVPNEVEINISIQEFTERTFEVPITVRNLPEGMDVKFFPSRANVSFSVTLEEYKKMAPEDFEIRLNYRDFKSNESGKVELVLTKSPENIINTRISPSSVEFLFENQ